MGKPESKKGEGVVRAARVSLEPADPGPGDVFSRIVEEVTHSLAKAVEGRGNAGVPFLEAATKVVQLALRKAAGMDSDLVVGAKAIVVGVLRAAGEKEGAALSTLSFTARAVIRETARIGGDLASSAKGLVLGAIASAKDLTVDRGDAAFAAARGALEGAQEGPYGAAEKVRAALKEPIGGVTIALPRAIEA